MLLLLLLGTPDTATVQDRPPIAITAPRPPQSPGLPPRDRSGRPPEPAAEGTASITGRVVDADTGQPLRRVSVRAFLTTASNPAENRPHETRTDDQGAYVLSKLPAGVWSVTAQRGGYVMVGPAAAGAVPASGPTGLPRPQRITLEDGQRLGGLDFRLQRGGVITGRVVDDLGEAAEGVTVSVLRARRMRGRLRYLPAGMRPVMTDDLGQFRVYGLPPGEYILAAEPGTTRMMAGITRSQDQDRTDSITTYAPGTPSPGDALSVTVAAGATASMDIQLLAGRVVTVAGRVVDSSGKPLEGGFVTLRPDGAEVLSPAGMRGYGIRQNGQFQIDGVAPGAYLLHVVVPPRGPATAPEDFARLESANVPLVVGDADVADLLVTTAPPSTATGRLVVEGDATKLPLDALRLFPRPVDPGGTTFGGPPGQGRVQPDGSVSIGGLRDEVALTLVGLPRGWWLKAVRLNGRDITDGFDFGVGRTWTGLDIVVNDRPASIGGQVLGAGGQPTTDFTVLVFPTDYAERATVRRPGVSGVGLPDQNGGFVIESLRPGDYFVVAAASGEADGAALDDPERLHALAERAERVTIKEGDLQFMALTLGGR